MEESVAKHTDALGQLIPLALVAVPIAEGELHEAPSLVFVNKPLVSTAMHAVVLPQLMAMRESVLVPS